LIKAARRQSETQEASYNSEQQEPLKCESVGMQHNGNSFEMGRMLGKLDAHMELHTQILLDIREGISDLPTQIAATISPASANHSPKPRILPELSELIRALYPVLILCAAVLGKSTWPTALPLLRAALEAAIHGAG